MGGGKGGGQTIGFRYFMSIHMGLCRGPVDEIVQIDAGDVRAWPFPDGASVSNEVSGGVGGGGGGSGPGASASASGGSGVGSGGSGGGSGVGGIPGGTAVGDGSGDTSAPDTTQRLMTIAEGPNGAGIAQYDDGTYQVVDSSKIVTIRSSGEYTIRASEIFGGDKKEGGIAGSLRAMMGSVTQVVPTYIKSMMGGRVPDFRGVATLFFDGLITSMNPYPKKWEFRVRRTHAGWDGEVWQPSIAAIWLRGGTIKGMNGAHILYEAFTNRDWGRGLSRDWIDEMTWLKSAQTLYNEGLGLCLRYNRQSELSIFVQEVLDHIGGSIYPDRSTGRMALSLLRDDYNLEDLPLFTYNSGLISLGDVDTAGQDDLVNEVVVKWQDPITKNERSARVQNLALNQSMGASNSTTATYAGISDVDLALRMCQRDLEANSNSLKRFNVVLDRRAWRLAPGMPFRISVPDRNIFNAVLRAGKVTEAGGSDGRITVEAVLDVYGLPSFSFIGTQEQEWVPPNRTTMIANRYVIREANYGELVRVLDPANLNMLEPTASIIGTIVGKPSPLSQAYDLLITPDGATTSNQGSGSFAPYIVSDEPIQASMGPTTLSFAAVSDIGIVSVGMAVQFGEEIGRLDAIDLDLGTITIARGCYDSVPLAHVSGTTFFFVQEEVGSDEREYASGEVLEVKILPFTSTNRLNETLAPAIPITVSGRQGRPYPPARLMINGVHFSALAHQSGNLVFSWNHRNRIIQQDQLIAHHEASVGPEAGTSYTIRVYDGTTLMRTVSDLTGTTWTYSSAMRTADSIEGSATFELEAVRSGLSSFNKYRFTVNYEQSGYGVSGYGDAYGD